MRLSALILILSMFSCVGIKVAEDKKIQPEAFFINGSENRAREDYVAKASLGMVATAHPLASRIGSNILAEGGNAIDAAVAASFAISVLRPQSTGIGGGGFMLVYRPSHPVLAYDYRERAPNNASHDMYIDANGQPKNSIYQGRVIPNPSVNGHLAVATPGLVAGLLRVHKDHGCMPLAKLMEPAIKLARSGFLVYADLAEAIEERRDILANFEDSKKIFLPDDSPLKVGQLLIQNDLAWTLEQIAKNGVKGFYEGPVSERLLDEIRLGQGILTRKDLEQYQVKMRDPVEGSYRGHRIVSMPPPSSGGVHIIEIFNILSHFDVASLGHSSTKTRHLFVEVMKRVFSDRATYLGDPDFVNVPVARLLSRDHAAFWSKDISFSRATPAFEIAKLKDEQRAESSNTTHISVVDSKGAAVSTTQTINYSFGSGVVARGTGIVLNDEMDDFSIKPGIPNVYGLVGNEANAIAAKKTMLSSMSPTMVFDPDGNLSLVLGSPGGPRIINATWQTIVNVIDFKMTLPDAVHSLRTHHQWLPDVTYVEPHESTGSQASELKKLGHRLETMSSIGDVQAIQIINGKKNKILIGVSDTRSNGKPDGHDVLLP